MALVYATTIQMNRRGMPGEPAPLKAVADVVGQWAGVDDGWSSGDRVGRRDARVRTEILGPSAAGIRGWRLQLVHPDSRDTAFVWAATVTAVQDTTTEVSVRLDRTRVAPGVALPRDTPAPPRCIRSLLESESIEARDAGRALATNVWLVGDDDAAELTTLVKSRARRLPIIAFTPRDEDALDGGVLLERVIGAAHVTLIRSSTTWRLDGLLPPGFNVYGGAVRIWWPGITEHSLRWDHRLWAGDVPARRIAGEVESMVLEASLAAARVDPRIMQLERARRDEEINSLRSEVADLRTRYDASVASTADEASDVAENRHRLEEAESTLVSQLTADLDEYQALADDFARENDDLRVRAGAAERERDYLREELSRVRAGERAPDDVDDSTASLIVQIEAEIRSRGDIDGARPRAFTLARQFVPIMEAHGGRYRSKIIKACADVAVGAPSLLGRREDHPLRAGDKASDPVRVREHDGAEARRCYVDHGTAGARRLHYWVRPDGAIEFASVNVHDDMNIPE